MLTPRQEHAFDIEGTPLLSPGPEVSHRPVALGTRLAWVGLLGWAGLATFLALRPSGGSSALAVETANLASLQDLAQTKGKETPSLYHVYRDVLQLARYVDLTHAFSPSSPVWPGFGPAEFGAGVAGGPMEGFVENKGDAFTYKEHGFSVGRYALTTDQYGTQLDPPAHWNEYGATISDVSATVAVRPLVVLDVHEKVKKNASYHATVADAKSWEEKHGTIPAGSVVMVRSDWSLGWESYKDSGLPDEFPGVSIELLKFLHKDRSILFHGHEPLDTDMTPALVGEAWLMHNNFMQAEGVTNLDKVPEYGCLVSIGFAKPKGGLGGFARYVAICPEETTPEGVSVRDESGAPLPQHKYPLRRDESGVMVPDKTAKPTAYCSSSSALGCVDGKPSWEDPN